MSTPVVSDYGGAAYGRRSVARKRAENQASMRCLDCHTVRYVSRLELARAAAPRCLKCGSALEEIERSRKRNGYSTKPWRQDADTRRCPGCGLKILSNQYLRLHLHGNKECLDYHADEGKLFDFRGVLIVPGTVEIVRVSTSPTTRPWAIVALACNDVVCELFRGKRRCDCDDLIDSELGPVELSR